MGLLNTHNTSSKNIKILFVLGVFLLSSIFSFLPSSQVGAVTQIDDMQPADAAKAFVYYKAFRTCLTEWPLKNYNGAATAGSPLSNTMSNDNAVAYEWFYNNFDLFTVSKYTDVGEYGAELLGLSDPRFECKNYEHGREYLRELVRLTGYSNGPEFLCAIGFTREEPLERCETFVENTDNDFVAPSDKGGALDDWWTNTIQASGRGPGDIGPGEYILYLQSFLRGCGVATASTGEYTIQVLNPSGTPPFIDQTYEAVDRNKGEDHSVRIYSGTTLTCRELADNLSKDSSVIREYTAWLRVPGNTPEGSGDIDIGDGTFESQSTCSINGIGWFLCPIITTTADIADGIYGFIEESFLEINVELLDTTGDNAGTYTAWTVMRDIANVAFVIVFLIIIFAQLTSLGVSNYGVKKMLPRLVVAAILVNISFFLCQLAVDLSNLAGYGTKEVFTSVGESIQSTARGENLDINNLDVNGSTGFDGWSVVSAGVILGTAGVVSYLALGSLIAVLVGAIVSILVIFFILILRQVLIVLLIVLSPLAFVAYLLPNTESLFTKWRKMFVALLLVFPITGLVFGASTLASNILVTVYSGDSQTGFDDTIAQIIAGGALVIPLIAVPFILKSALNSVGNLGSMINKIGGRASGGASKMARKGYDNTRLGKAQQYQKERRATNRALTQAGAYTGKNILRRGASKLNQKFNTSKLSGKSGDRLAAQGLGLARETEGKEAAEQATLLRSQIASGAMTNEKLDAEAAKAFKNGDRVRTKAIQDVMFEQGGSGIDRYTNAVRKAQATPGGMSGESFNAMRENINSKHGQTVKSKAAPLSKLAGVGGKLEEHEKDVDTWAMSAGDLATQTKGQLQYAADNGLINPETASAMISDRRIAERLDPSQYAALQQASKQTKETYTEKKTAKQKVEQDKIFDTYVDAGNVETYRQAGEKKVAQAAEGSSGSTPFVVDSSGSVEANTASGKARSTQAEAAQGQPSSGGVFTVDHSGTTEAPQKPAPSVLDTSPEAVKTVDAFNSDYRSMDRTEYTQPNPADISNVPGQSNTTSVNIPVTAPPAETPAPVDTNNPYRTMDQSQPEKIDPSDISGVTGDKKLNNIDVPTDNNNDPDKT